MNRNSSLVEHRCSAFKRRALALAIGSAVVFATGPAFAQAVNGTINGQVPVAAGEAIQITNASGFNRTITVGPSGTYSVTLPVGTYTVTLLQNGKAVTQRRDVTPVAAGSVQVNFTQAPAAATPQTLGQVNVSANSIPPIDVSTTNFVTTISAKQLQMLPLGRSAADVAMLAPGVTQAAATDIRGPNGGQLLSFGGASVAENAYYVDGMNTTGEILGVGGLTLPYGSILEQQTFTAGYGAKYGRSIGGVINQLGKAGSNEWHFGARAIWQPASWRESPVNQYWNNPLYVGPGTNPAEQQGQLRTLNSQDHSQETIYDAYVSGPIIKNKLTFFLSLEQDRQSGNTVGSLGSNRNTFYTTHLPKVYAKVNWNINENNILTVSGLQNSIKSWSDVYGYDYPTRQTGAFRSAAQTTKATYRMWVAHYTSFITDNLTVNAMFGKIHGENNDFFPPYAGFNPSLPFVGGASAQNPAFVPPGGITSDQNSLQMANPGVKSSVTNYRLSVSYHWRNHTFEAGIDNVQTWDIGDGNVMTGPGYAWIYGHANPAAPILGTSPDLPPFVAAPNSAKNGQDGYYVSKFIKDTNASVRVQQKAQYITDAWQITPNFLLDIGLRNDQFANHTVGFSPNVRYLALTKPQWAPRVGFSWNVHGDSTLKVFGNAGRYYLALPARVARPSATIATSQYFTYAGINSQGEPIGLTPIAQNNGGHTGMGVSSDNDYGQPPDLRTVAATNLQAEYSDNFSVGMDQEFHFAGQRYVFGANAQLQKMGPNIVDDWDDGQSMCRAAIAQGVGYTGVTAAEQITSCLNIISGDALINPTRTSDLLLAGSDGNLHKVVVTAKDQGFPQKVSRKYYAVNLSLSHPFDGKWFGKIAYTWSRLYGNTEGPTNSIEGNGSSDSLTESWDFAQIMELGYGVLPNNHTNQLKAYGAYQINPDWLVSGSLFIESGRQGQCRGLYGPDQTDPVGYGNSYHWCGGVPMPPGSTPSDPWTHQLNLAVRYSPSWADHRLAFKLSVFNVMNKQTPIYYNASYGSTVAPDPSYQLVEGWTPPRMWQFEASYNW